MRRVVITGMGVVSPLGCELGSFWDSIKAGECGIGPVTRFDASQFDCRIAGEVRDFNAEDYIDRKEARRMDRFAQYAVAAAKMALSNSGLDLEKVNSEMLGVVLGCGVGGFELIEAQHRALLEKGPGRVSPFFIPMMISNIAPGLIAIMAGAKGISETITAACASGTNAVGSSFRAISRGDADIIITGGSEAPITPLAFAGFCSMKAMSVRNDIPALACSPFDLNRDGFIMSEGAGILILEELEHARARGADIICEVAGYGSASDAYHITAPAPEGEGGARAMARAIADAGLEPKDIDYINAHGTSTPYNDKFETAAIKTVFKEWAKKLAVSSTKGMTGHMLGAAGGIEAIITAMAIKEGFMPATINLKTPDPECDLDYVPNAGRYGEIRAAISNSLGFGGHNSSILLKKY